MTRRCPNCYCPVEDHPDNACVLAALVGVIHDREHLTPQELLDLHANCNVDEMWDRLGPIIDDLEDGRFNTQDDT